MKKITSGFLAASLAIPSVILINSADQVEAQTQKEVTAHSLNVRSGPSDKSKIVDWLGKGDIVNVLNDGNGWDYVQFDNGKKGYVYDKHLKDVVNKTNTNNVTYKETYKVNTQSLTLRTGPSANHKAIDWLPRNTIVDVISTSGNWNKVSVNGKVGYVNGNYLTKTQTVVNSNTSVNTNNTQTSNNSTVTKEVSAYWLTMRNGAGTNYKAVDYLKKGTEVIVHSYSGKWSYISANGKKGYVHSDYLIDKKTTKPTTDQAIVNAEIKYVNASDGLNLRTGRGVTNSVLLNIPYGSEVKVSDVQKGWGKVTFNNKTGYVNISYLTGQKPVVNNTNNTVPVKTNNQTTSLKGKTIVLDPGHGGKFAGAQGIVHEEDVNLAISLKTRTKLQEMGANVIMTRTSDVSCSTGTYNQDLICRPAIATKSKASAFISIHANSGVASANGAETFYYNASRGDQRLATNILDEIIEETGVKKRKVAYANFAVLRNSTVPSTLIETGFVSNKNDAAKLGDPIYQGKFAKAIAEGIEESF